jgi:hypothetical protein
MPLPSIRYLFLLGLLFVVGTARAQDGVRYAAALTVTFGGVDVRLANTERWIALPVGAVTPLGAGDSVRTDQTGRAWLTFETDTDTAARALILPATIYRIESYDADAIHARIAGRSIAHVPAGSPSYTVLADTAEAERSAIRADGATDALFAVSARPAAPIPFLTTLNARPPILYAIAASDGTAIVTEDGDIPLPNGYGAALDGESAALPISLSAPYRFSDLEVAVTPLVCDATAIPTTAPRLLARIGANDGFRSLGAFDFGVPLQIVGRSENGRRYRIAYFSAFAWVVADGVSFTGGCDVDALPVYPSETAEQPLGAIAVTDAELALLQPFYGTPADDPWFYRAVSDLVPAG